jgi:hypothetical protein
MTAVLLDYAAPSKLTTAGGRSELGLAGNRRRPVRFHARVKQHVLPLRLALQALGEVVWSNDTRLQSVIYFAPVLDPVITVHPDRVFFEAFSQDQSVYGLVIANRDLFEPEGEVRCGTTNIDFTSWLWAALGEMRSSRETWLRIEAAGFAIHTEGGAGRFERKVDIPDSWVSGFLQLQGAMALPGTRVRVRPVDLLAVVRFLQQNRAKTSPRALRYEFIPGSEVRAVLEPWEQVIPLRETEHNYSEKRIIRTWGRRRLRLLEAVLPHAESVTVYLKGRALPSFYAVQLPGVTFVLGLSGWTGNTWSDSSAGLGELAGQGTTADVLARALETLRDGRALGEGAVARALHVEREEATAALVRLCRQGRAVYDVERREYRHRELFETPIDEARYFPPDPRKLQARAWQAGGAVQVADSRLEEVRKVRKTKTPRGPVEKEVCYRMRRLKGSAGDQQAVEVVLSESGRILFGTCGCAFFRENLLNRGPCEHILALALGGGTPREGEPVVPAEALPPLPPLPRTVLARSVPRRPTFRGRRAPFRRRWGDDGDMIPF